MERLQLSILGLVLVVVLPAQTPRTEILKWQDGKQACVSLTYDDSTINQFRIAVPLMNERGLPGTFFVITGGIPGSRYRQTFVGRPLMEILRESETVPTTRENAFERASMLAYLKDVQRLEELREFAPQRVGRLVEQGNFEMINTALGRLRQTGVNYTVRERESPRERPNGLTWEEFRRYAAQGHEFANHTVSHPYLAGLDEANLLHEAEKAREDLWEQVGPQHTFSIEAPYGIHDERVGRYLTPRFPLTRNWVTDDFMDGIMRGDSRPPKDSRKEYVQWQRGPITSTPLETMTGWIDTAVDTGAWLVLVIHGIEGIGWEALPTERVRAYFDYIKKQERRLWVATFQDGAKYARERMSSKVTTRAVGERIEVSLNHTLDPALYNLPLTARTTVPAGWKAVRFRQGETARQIPLQGGAGEASVTYRITPNAGVAVLENASN